MSHKYLSIALLLLANAAHAQITSGAITAPAQDIMHGETLSPMSESERVPAMVNAVKPFAPGPYNSGGGRRGTIFGSYELGYANSTSKKNGVNGSGGGLAYKLEYGGKYLMPTRSQDRYNFISASLFFCYFSTKESYKLAGVDTKTKYSVRSFGLPLSYCSINLPHNVGYYWELGVNFNTLGGETDNKTGINTFAKFYVEPVISAGLSIHVERKKGVGAILLGPYVGYSATNLTKDSGGDMRVMTIGIKYTGVLL